MVLGGLLVATWAAGSGARNRLAYLGQRYSVPDRPEPLRAGDQHMLSGRALDAVRPIRDDIRARIERLVDELPGHVAQV